MSAPAGLAQAAPKPSPSESSSAAIATPAAAALAEVSMICAADQVDINTATAEALVAAFGLDSDVAARLIEYRPYLAPRDLSVVEGIGPGTLAKILTSEKGCATPTTSPPPAPSPCATTSTVDLQSATAVEIAKVTGLNRNAAEQIVAARPFASLSHVTPERVPGVGKGILDTVVSRSCLTPQPVREAQSSWRWAYPAYPTTVERDGYALAAPAGVIDATSGAWLSITPVPSKLPGEPYPSADFHIHGAWTGPQAVDGPPDEVRVTVPAASFAGQFPSAEFEPYLVHHGSTAGTDGENVYGSKVSVDPVTGAVTGRVSSLSLLDWGMRRFNYLVEPTAGVLFGNRYTAPACDSPWAQRPGTATYDASTGAHASLMHALMDLPGNPVPLSGFLVKHCVQTGPGANSWGAPVQVKLRNNTGTIQKLAHSAGDVAVDGDHSFEADIVSLLLTKVQTGGDVYLAPGQIGKATVPAGTFGTAEMQPDRLRSVMRIGLDKGLGWALNKLGPETLNDPAVREVLEQMADCAYTAMKAASGSGWQNISRDFAWAVHQCFDYPSFYTAVSYRMQQLIEAGLLSEGRASQIVSGLLDVREYIKWLEYGQVTVDLADSLIWGGLGRVPLMIEHWAAKPTRDEMGRLVRAQCLRDDGYVWKVDMACQDRYAQRQGMPTGGGGDTGLPAGKIIRNTNGNTWFVSAADSKMHPIEDGGTYICLSKHYAVDWGVDLEDLQDYRQASGPNGEPATCDGSLAATRQIGPQYDLGDSTVLRFGDGPRKGESWVVHAGHRYPIPSGTEFNCWVNPRFESNMEFDVWDFITEAELNSYPTDPGVNVSNCGDPENPSF